MLFCKVCIYFYTHLQIALTSILLPVFSSIVTFSAQIGMIILTHPHRLIQLIYTLYVQDLQFYTACWIILKAVPSKK